MRITPGLLSLLASACVANTTDPRDPTDPDPIDPTDPVLPRLQECRGRAFVPAPTEDWRHSIQSPIITAAGAANHLGRDLIVKASTDATLNAKFTYGLISKDLEDEDVRVSLDDCTGWIDLGDHTTDGDGQIRVGLTRVLPIGIYDVMFQVLGDGSTTRASIWVLPAGTKLILTDIDGTLTSSDRQLFEQILDGSHVPVAYPDAVALTTAHRGYIPVYLTGRPDWLQGKTRAWLADLGFAKGPVRVTDSNTQILPTEGSVGDFKKAVITKLLADYDITFAYGNATTDIYAYLGAGLDPADVWIIGSHGGEQSTHDAGAAWTERAAEVAALPAATQPFVR